MERRASAPVFPEEHLSENGQNSQHPQLKRALGRFDLVLLFVVAVFNLNVVPSIAANGGRVVGYGLMVLGVFALWQRDTIGLWYILIGMFLRSAAGQSYRDVMSEVLLRDVPARDLMAPPPDPVEWSTTLLDLLDTVPSPSFDVNKLLFNILGACLLQQQFNLH